MIISQFREISKENKGGFTQLQSFISAPTKKAPMYAINPPSRNTRSTTVFPAVENDLKNTRFFDPSIACLDSLGVTEAIVFHQLQHLIRFRIEKEENEYKGEYYHTVSAGTLHEKYLPFLTVRKIEIALKKLMEEGKLLSCLFRGEIKNSYALPQNEYIEYKTLHHFRIDDALKFGVKGAILIKAIELWIKKAAQSKENFIEGRFYMYRTSAMFSQDNPYFSALTIKKTLRKLRQVDKDGKDTGIVKSIISHGYKSRYSIDRDYLTPKKVDNGNTPPRNDPRPPRNDTGTTTKRHRHHHETTPLYNSIVYSKNIDTKVYSALPFFDNVAHPPTTPEKYVSEREEKNKVVLLSEKAKTKDSLIRESAVTDALTSPTASDSQKHGAESVSSESVVTAHSELTESGGHLLLAGSDNKNQKQLNSDVIEPPLHNPLAGHEPPAVKYPHLPGMASALAAREGAETKAVYRAKHIEFQRKILEERDRKIQAELKKEEAAEAQQVMAIQPDQENETKDCAWVKEVNYADPEKMFLFNWALSSPLYTKRIKNVCDFECYYEDTSMAGIKYNYARSQEQAA